MPVYLNDLIKLSMRISENNNPPEFNPDLGYIAPGNITQLIQWISLTKRLPSHDAESSIERNNYETLNTLRNNISDDNTVKYCNNFFKWIYVNNLDGIPKVVSISSPNIYEAIFAQVSFFMGKNLPVNIHSEDHLSVKRVLLVEAVKAGEILDSKILRILADESPYTKSIE